jgi:poly [ADP-ribose] polymerase 2/3/4
MPKKTGRSQPAQPLAGCKIAVTGSFGPGVTQDSIKRESEKLGATSATNIDKSTTHLISTQVDFDKPTAKVKKARDLDIHIVSYDWLTTCAKDNKRHAEDEFSLPHPGPTRPATSAKANGKRPASPDGADSADNSGPPSKKPKANGSNTRTRGKPAEHAVDTGDANGESSSSAKPLNIPVDEKIHEMTPTLSSYVVYIDDDKTIWDASLNQSNSSANNNKFYRLQVCRCAVPLGSDLLIPPVASAQWERRVQGMDTMGTSG